MNACSDPRVHKVVGVFASQTGKTDMTLNLVGFHIHHDPAPILVIQPTLEMAKAWSKDRLAPMLRDTPALRGKVQDPRSRDSDNTLLHKAFRGGHITIAGSNSPASLASRPIRIVICDEVDRYAPSAGTEGDPVKLAETRSATFWNSVLIEITSPGIRGESRIEVDWEKSDKRLYFVPCPDCGEFQTLKWAQVQWDKDEHGDPLPETAVYVCPSCGSCWDDIARWASVRRGEWRATEPFRGVAGFHLNALNAPWERRKLARLVEQWLEAQGNPELLKVFVNTVLAEWWEDEEGDGVDPTGLMKRRKSWAEAMPRGAELPEGVAVVTFGLDVGKDRVEYEIVGWGRAEESWSLRYGRIYGDIAQDPGVLEEVDDIHGRPLMHAKGVELYIRAACLDSGYATETVYRFCKPRLRRPLPDGFSQFVFAVKGRSEFGRPIWPEKAGGTKKLRGLNLWTIGVDAAKDSIYGRLRIADPGAGYCHWPVDRPGDYFIGLTAEHTKTRYVRGQRRRAWELKSQALRNEPLDCRVYAYTALVGIQSDPFLLDLERECGRIDSQPWVPIDQASAQGESMPAPSRPAGRRRRSRGVER